MPLLMPLFQFKIRMAITRSRRWGGVAGGVAATVGTFSLVGALGTASTGVAISSLSGAAATNATLAALGGGSLATGGLGMLGGMCALGGIFGLATVPCFLTIKSYGNISKYEESIKALMEILSKFPPTPKIEKLISEMRPLLKFRTDIEAQNTRTEKKDISMFLPTEDELKKIRFEHISFGTGMFECIKGKYIWINFDSGCKCFNEVAFKNGLIHPTTETAELFDKITRFANFFKKDEEENAKDKEKLALKNFLEERGIKFLYHFTDESNIESIKRWGLLPVSELQKKNLPYKKNDDQRFDNRLDCISLSVSQHNEDLLKAFRFRGIHPVRLKINAAILYEQIENKRFYCDRNAAASSCQCGCRLSDFKNLFRENIAYTNANGVFKGSNRSNKKINEPTDIQAEILWANHVDRHYIISMKYL